MHADVVVSLPEGWRQVDNGDGPLTYSPDAGKSVLQISAQTAMTSMRGKDLAELEPSIKRIIEGTGIGRVQLVKPFEAAYGAAVLAKLYHRERPASVAWMLVPSLHVPLFITLLSGDPVVRVEAMEIVRSLEPGVFSVAVAAAVARAGVSLAESTLASHALLVADGQLAHVQLASLPQPIWDEACRHERARHDAEIVVQVLAGKERDGERDLAVIYAESKDRHRRVVVRDGNLFEVDDATRLDLFRAADPRIAAALTPARA